jgi:hypothetical protein
MLTLIVGLEASGNRSNRAPLSNRNSLTPSTVVTSVGGAACASCPPARLQATKPNEVVATGSDPVSKPKRNIDESRLRITVSLSDKTK